MGVAGVAGAEAVSMTVVLSVLVASMSSPMGTLVSGARDARKITSAMASVLQAAAAWRATCVGKGGRLAVQCRQRRMIC